MSNRTQVDFDGQEPARSRIGWGFTAGVLVGLTGAIAGLGLAVAAQRRTRAEKTTKSSDDLHAQDLQARQDEELDEELAQTFPASDPLPQSHRVD
jgi:hypothetical protein